MRRCARSSRSARRSSRAGEVEGATPGLRLELCAHTRHPRRVLTSTPARRLTVIEQWAMYLTDDASPLDGLLTIDGRAPADFGQRGRSFVALWPVSRWGAEHCVEAMWLPETTRVRNLGAVRCAGREAR